MGDVQKFQSGLRMAMAVAGLLTCAAADSHPDGMEKPQRLPAPQGPSSPPPSGRLMAPNQPGSPPNAGPRPLNECGNAEVPVTGPAPIRTLPNRGYTPKISMSTGFVTHLHQDDSTALQHLMVKPQGQFAELWYVAEQRWLDQAGTCVRYCVFPRIEVTGDATWNPIGWGRPSAPILNITINGVVNSIALDTELRPKTSFELPHSDAWCKAAPALARPTVVLSVPGYEEGVTVNFGSTPKQPPRGPAIGNSPITEKR